MPYKSHTNFKHNKVSVDNTPAERAKRLADQREQKRRSREKIRSELDSDRSNSSDTNSTTSNVSTGRLTNISTRRTRSAKNSDMETSSQTSNSSTTISTISELSRRLKDCRKPAAGVMPAPSKRPRTDGVAAAPTLAVEMVYGTMHQGSLNFPSGSRGQMCTACAIVALCISSHIPLREWTRETVDSVLLIGDKFYQQCIRVRHTYAPNITHPYLSIDEVTHDRNNRIVITDFAMGFRATEIIDQVKFGYLLETRGVMLCLRDGLNDFFSNANAGIIVCASQTMAIKKEAGKYCLIDSHSREGLRYGNREPDPNAFLMRCPSLEELTLALLEIFLRYSNQGPLQYTLNSVQIEMGPAEVIVPPSDEFRFATGVVSRRRSTRSKQQPPQRPVLAMKSVVRARTTTASNRQCTLGPMTDVCKFCGALKFVQETAFGCCKQGQISIPVLDGYPELFRALLDGDHPCSKEFKRNIRAYNSNVAMASVSAKYETVPGRGAPIVKISGIFHHRIGGVSRNDPRFGSVYICAGSADPSCDNPALNVFLLTQLRRELTAINPYVKTYKQMGVLIDEYERRHQVELPNLYINFYLNPTTDRRRYNAPTDENEIGAVFVSADGQVPPMPDKCIRIYYNSGQVEDMSRTWPISDPLCYPVLFPRGELGWAIDMQLSNVRGKRKRITMREFFVFRFQIRRGKYNPILSAGKLTQQFVVDSYVKIEGDRLHFVRNNQAVLRAEHYDGLVDYIHRRAEDGELAAAGRVYILPSTFQGGQRFMVGNYQDSMAMVAKFGKPTFFITMTCNAKWTEIEENLCRGQVSSDRPDLVVRVFKQKLKMLMDDLLDGKIFGKVLCWVYVIEFQKRGLPHAHISITVDEADSPKSPEEIDRLISAELPKKTDQPELHQAVLDLMTHGPCGDKYPDSPCMTDGMCKKKYPFSFAENTVLSEGRITYRRRQSHNFPVAVRGHEVDNKWVIPYNPQLLLKYRSHINVLFVANIGCVKYLYKYITKGHDAALYLVQDRRLASDQVYDEISEYVESRYVSACESMWRIFAMNMIEKSHKVVRLPVHLPNEKTVFFHENDDLEVLIDRADSQVSLLEEYFRLNARDEFARTLYYVEIPEYYVFRDKSWHRRQRRAKTMGRIYSINPRSTEKFHLRVLLLHIKGATSYEYLLDPRDGNPAPCISFRESARRRLLIGEDDLEWERTLLECSTTNVPGQVRKIYCYLVTYSNVVGPRGLYDKFREHFMEDYVRRGLSEYEAEKRALIRIETFLRYLDTSLSTLDDFSDLLRTFNIDETIRQHQMVYTGGDVDVDDEPIENFYINPEGRLHLDLMHEVEREMGMFNHQQAHVYQTLFEAVTNTTTTVGGAKCFYLQGAGGTGKTFVYNVLLKSLEHFGIPTLAVAHTGIAALLLRNGRTAHSTFKLPLDINESSTSSISRGSQDAERIKRARLIVWDEISMSSHYIIDTVDRLLRDLHEKNDLPFGGVCILFGGDLRQLLPVNRGSVVQLEHTFINCAAWRYFNVMELTVNMRTDPGAHDFAEWLLRLGNGTETPDPLLTDILPPCSVQIPEQCVTRNVVDDVYGDVFGISEPERLRAFTERMVLCSLNRTCDIVNDRLIDLLPGEVVISLSVDSIETDDVQDRIKYQEEVLNARDFSGLPKHELKLKIGVPIILLRNISMADGLVNGTRMIVRAVSQHLLTGEIISGTHRGEYHVIPRLDLSSRDCHFPFTLKRRQFPVKVCFAMTINKAQGQTFRRVGIYLPQPVFAFGQLYVAFSRTVNFESVKVQVDETPVQGRLIRGNPRVFTRNLAPVELLRRLEQQRQLP